MITKRWDVKRLDLYRSFVVSMLLASLFLWPSAALPGNESSPGKPNIVLFFIDDMGWTDVSYMYDLLEKKERFYETPHIDKLAAKGTVFLNAYANAPNCAPSRACLMSGQYTPRHGIYTVGDPERGNHQYRKLIPTPNRTVLPEKVITMAEALQQNGYTTASMGKWHLGSNPVTQGFDVNNCREGVGFTKWWGDIILL